ncbi:MAG: hypothetical protein U9O98_00810 [Asgard group archaeon]|nr:hypothetical protein [Asgard group archaeon]
MTEKEYSYPSTQANRKQIIVFLILDIINLSFCFSLSYIRKLCKEPTSPFLELIFQPLIKYYTLLQTFLVILLIISTIILFINIYRLSKNQQSLSFREVIKNCFVRVKSFFLKNTIEKTKGFFHQQRINNTLRIRKIIQTVDNDIRENQSFTDFCAHSLKRNHLVSIIVDGQSHQYFIAEVKKDIEGIFENIAANFDLTFKEISQKEQDFVLNAFYQTNEEQMGLVVLSGIPSSNQAVKSMDNFFKE